MSQQSGSTSKYKAVSVVLIQKSMAVNRLQKYYLNNHANLRLNSEVIN